MTETSITSAEIWTIRVPLPEPVYLDSTLIKSRDFAIAKVQTKGGNCGWGATFTRGMPVEQAAENLLIPRLVGQDALASHELWKRMREATGLAGPNSVVLRALSVLDIALWDIKAKHVGLPLYRLLGGIQKKLPILIPMGYRKQPEIREEDFLEEAAHYLDNGVSALKLMCSPRIFESVPNLPASLRKVAGATAFLGNDFLSLGEREKITRLCATISEANFDFLEDPFLTDDERAYAHLQTVWKGAILTGENASTLREGRRVISLPSISGVRWDATVCGGVTGWLKMQSLAEAHKLPVYAHCAPEIHAHLVSSTGQNYLETTFPAYDTIGLRNVMKDPLPIRSGYYELSDEPGIGSGVDWEKAAGFRVR